DLEVKGNIVEHEYTIEDGRTKVAEVSMKWFRVADTYGVEVAPGQDPVVILAVTAVLDTMAHPGRVSLGQGSPAVTEAMSPSLRQMTAGIQKTAGAALGKWR